MNNQTEPIDFLRFLLIQQQAQQANQRPCPKCGELCPIGPHIRYCDMCGAALPPIGGEK